MVRLKPGAEVENMKNHFKFQSHNGSIKTFTVWDSGKEIFYFNPTMVRLKLAEANKQQNNFYEFQSHNGSI